MSPLIISVSGLRGVVGESLTPDVVVRYLAAFASQAPDGPLVLSRDGRATGGLFADLAAGVLAASGRTVWDAGVAATPTVGVLTRHLGASGAVQISASHNPPPYNGIKLFGGDGRVLDARSGRQVRELYDVGVSRWSPHDRIGLREMVADPHAAHLDLVLATVDVKRIRSRRFRVLLDSNHGAGGLLGRQLLESLGCELVALGATPDGQFAHPPEPTAENLSGVLDQVRTSRVAVGFCQDPDADRLAIIDERGRYIGEECTLALCLDHVLRTRPGAVVVNCATSRMAEDLAQRHGATLHRSAVGEANVVDEMLRRQATFGGEGNGGPIDPRVGLVRDSFVGMALVLDALAASEAPLSAWVDSLPRYSICKSKADVAAERVGPALDRLVARWPEAQASRLDGLRLDWDDRWLLLRASNTEPIVRAIAEAPIPEAAQALCDEALRLLEE